MKILVVDDDTALTQLISNRLKKDNYVVEVASNGEYAIDLLEAAPCSLVILDIGLPTISGLEVCHILRRRGHQTPILMLTGKDHTQDKVMGLDAGADDYLVKPFELNELTARVRALLRRNTQEAAAVLSYGDLQFDPSDQTLMYQGIPVNLRPKELAILELLLRYQSRIFSPEALLDQLWNLAECPSKATIKTHIRSLRKQLTRIGAINVIETLYGRGYRLNPSFLGASSDTEAADRAKPKQVSEHRTQPRTTATPEETAREPKKQTIIKQTWQQVQGLNWQRLVQLQALVRSFDSVPTKPASTDGPQGGPHRKPSHPRGPAQQSPFIWQENWQKAMTIVHQLKGNLGSFGFHAASSQAQKIEDQLQKIETHRSPTYLQIIEPLIHDVERLEQLLKIHIDNDGVEFPAPNQAFEKAFSQGTRTASLLVVSRDRNWNTQLQSQQHTEERSAFTLDLCTPSDVSNHLLHHTPTAILLEISGQHLPLDLGLLGVLMSNYSSQVPLLGLIDPQHYRQYSQQALQKGANATISKGWTISTVLAITAEYLS